MVKNSKENEPEDAAVVFSGVSKTYTHASGECTQALDRVNLRVPSGRTMALLGPTGCGKTTLLNLAAGHLSLDQGKITLGPGLRRGQNVAYVFQQYTLLPWLSVCQNVGFGLKLRGMRKRDRTKRAMTLLEQVGLSDAAKTLPHELSGGMRQRAAIAQALAMSPKLLLMDEPFGALDNVTRHALQRLLIEVQRKQDLTVMFVTHNIDEAITVADKVVVFGQQGCIIETLDVDLAHPRDRASKEFTDRFVQIRRTLSNQE